MTYEYYMGDPEIRRRSWQMRRANRTLHAEPNVAHHAVTALERSGVPVRVITQNVDGLHQLAGMPDRKVLELHGTARTVMCTACGARAPDDGRAGPRRGGRERSAVPGVRRHPQVRDGDVR
ncbi:NAD-dependent deacetylase [Streptomyces alboflavus]|uniref:protein acetyllysine N-acetyltransferase n=1 Tax=Streptomyces alboflavus TaxID=67267 RepID=A0A1Z1WRK6_9ACTN|nr:NAD-dependent deacetylase [Streptomyces alboflavus]